MALEDEVVKRGREYARAHGTSLNGLIRQLLAREVMPERRGGIDEVFELMDRAGGRSDGRKWTREELYDV